MYCVFKNKVKPLDGNSSVFCSLSAQLRVQPTWRTWRTWMSRDTRRCAPRCACPDRAPPVGRVAPGRTCEVSSTHGGGRSRVFACLLNRVYFFSCCKSRPPSSRHLSRKTQNLNSLSFPNFHFCFRLESILKDSFSCFSIQIIHAFKDCFF